MNTASIQALHEVHTATNDVLTGYGELAARAEPEIKPVILQLTEMHERHREEQAALLSTMRESRQDDSSVQGTVNKVVVVLRDWLSDLDRDILPAVRDGEESLLAKFDDAYEEARSDNADVLLTLLTSQRAAIRLAVATLPAS